MPNPIELGSALATQDCVLLDEAGHAAVDIPLDVIASMVVELLRRDLLCASKTEAILHACAESLNRREHGVSGPIH